MFFDTTLQIFSMDVSTVVPEEGEGEGHLMLTMISGIAVPSPQGRQILPVGVVKVPIGRELALAKAKEIQEAAELLPEPKPESDLAVVHSMEEARQAAEMDEAIRSGNVPA